MKCYLLSSGSYSDHGVIAVFSTKEAAEDVRSRHPDCEVEERELDPGVIHAREGYRRYFVKMDSETGNIHGKPFEAHPDDDALGTTVQHGARPPDGTAFPQWPPMDQWIKTLGVYCWARDFEHAVKIASEYRRSMLAEDRR